MLKYAKALRFDEVPDYEWLKGLFSDLFSTLNYKVSAALDWFKDEVSETNPRTKEVKRNLKRKKKRSRRQAKNN